MTGKQNFVQFLKFVAVMVSAGLIQIAVFTLLQEFAHFDSWFSQAFATEVSLKFGPSYFVALVASVIFSFTVNRRYTFKSATNIPIAMMKLTIYYIIFTFISTTGGEYLAQIGWNEYVTLGVNMIVNFITEYLVCRFWLYRKSMNTNALAQRDAEKQAAKGAANKPDSSQTE